MEKKKLYYLPGFISIIGLPVLLLLWGPADPDRSTVVDAGIAPITVQTKAGAGNRYGSFAASLHNKKILSIDLNEMVWNEQSSFMFNRKLQFAASQMQQLQFTNDTTAVLRVNFGEKNNFSSIAWILNQAMLCDLRQYAFSGDELYLFANPPAKHRYASAAMAEPAILLPGINNNAHFTPRYSMRLGIFLIKNKWQYLFYHQQQNVMLMGGFIFLVLIPALAAIRMVKRRTVFSLQQLPG
jgi:hypothetical protein